MTTLTDKLLGSDLITNDDWNDHLVYAHKNEPSMSPKAFASYQTDQKINSYETLASQVDFNTNDSVKILDLACGDGYFFPFLLNKFKNIQIVGIDMSEGELNQAKSNFKNEPRVSLHNCMAQSIPEPPSTFDAVVCHMAFMLMLPLDPVINELSRVMKKNSKFSAIIRRPKSDSENFLEIERLSNHFISQQFPDMKQRFRLDSRAFSHEGWVELFVTKSNFSQVHETVDFDLNFYGNANDLWEFWRNMYYTGMLSEKNKNELRLEFNNLVEKRCDAAGKIHFGFPMRLLEAVK